MLLAPVSKTSVSLSLSLSNKQPVPYTDVGETAGAVNPGRNFRPSSLMGIMGEEWKSRQITQWESTRNFFLEMASDPSGCDFADVFKYEIKDIIYRDAKDEFLLFISYVKDLNYTVSNGEETIWYYICRDDAVEIARAIMEEDTGITQDVKEPLYLLGRTIPLIEAASGLSPRVVEYIASKVAHSETEISEGLNAAIQEAWSKVEWLCRRRSPGDEQVSCFKLIILLFLPEMKIALKTIKHLASLLRAEEVLKIAYNVASGGKFLHLALLLLVVRKKVNCCRMRNYISSSNKDSTEMEELVRHGLLLLDIFDRVGGGLEDYLLQLEKYDEVSNVEEKRVVDHVCLILSDADFLLSLADYNIVYEDISPQETLVSYTLQASISYRSRFYPPSVRSVW